MASANYPDDASGLGGAVPASAPAFDSRASGFALSGVDVQSDMFRSLADHSLEFIGMCDLAFKPFYLNQAGMKMVGLDSSEEACAVKVQDFFFPEDQRFIMEAFFPKVLMQGTAEVEIRFRHFKTAAALWMIYNVFQVTDARGQVSGYATVSRNITERKNAEQKVRESEERYRILVDGAVDGIFIADPKGRYVDANPAGCAMLGRTREEVLKSTFLDVLAPEEHPRWQDTIASFADGQVHLSEWRFRQKDGSVFIGELAGRQLPDGRLQGVLRDATDRKRAEDGLREERDFSAAVLETAGALVVVLDREGRIRRFNRACAVLTGYTEDEVLGRPVWLFILPEDAAGVRREWNTLSSGIRKSQHENHWLARDGTRRLIAWSNTVLCGANGEIQHVIGTGLDITEQRRAEQALRRSEVRQGYLLQLGDALRPLKDPVEIQEAAVQVLGERLGAARALYFEVRGQNYVIERDYANGVRPLRGSFPISAFGAELWAAYQAGKTMVVSDLSTHAGLSPKERLAYAAIQIGAHVGVPLVKEGRLVAGLAVHAQARREWAADEIALVEETAERTWAAVGRSRAEEALRQSEENYRTLFSSIDEGFA